MTTRNLFDFLYIGNFDPQIDDPAYKPPAVLRHGEWEQVATLAGDGDGQNVVVYEMRMPARFYKIVAHPTPNSIDEMREGFALSTGSGQDELAFQIARAISEGMLGLHECEEVPA